VHCWHSLRDPLFLLVRFSNSSRRNDYYYRTPGNNNA
jgi:hypothetical protein